MGAEVTVHFWPKLVDIQIPPPATTAIICFPSADEATDAQLVLGALAECQLVPKLVEVQMRPTLAATTTAPLLEQATEVQLALGALVKFQLPPEFVEV
jgi:hypothetical protein